jgi:hypothetical protein
MFKSEMIKPGRDYVGAALRTFVYTRSFERISRQEILTALNGAKRGGNVATIVGMVLKMSL